MAGMMKRLMLFVGKQVAERYTFDAWVRERLGRQEFFYNAFSALSYNGIDGDYAEFGSHGGTTFALAYRESRRCGHGARLWSFDSFQGLPPSAGVKDEHPAWKAGRYKNTLDEFHRTCASKKIPREMYTVVPGFYEQTLPTMPSGAGPTNIALAYIDCDMYSSTKTVLEFLMPRIKHGMIIGFDDYFCWSPTQMAGERRAMLECFSKERRWELVPFVQFGWHGNSFVVEDRTAGRD